MSLEFERARSLVLKSKPTLLIVLFCSLELMQHWYRFYIVYSILLKLYPKVDDRRITDDNDNMIQCIIQSHLAFAHYEWWNVHLATRPVGTWTVVIRGVEHLSTPWTLPFDDMMTGWSFCGDVVMGCRAGSLVFLKYLTVGVPYETKGFEHLLTRFKWPKWFVNGSYQPLTNWDDPPSRVFTTKKTQRKDCSFKTPKLPDELKGFEVTQRKSQWAIVHYCRSGVSTKFCLVERLFTPNKIPRLGYFPIVHCAFFVGVIVSAAVWHLPDWNPGDKNTARFCWNTFGQMASEATISPTLGKQTDNSNASWELNGWKVSFLETGWNFHHFLPKIAEFRCVASGLFLLPGSLYPYWKMMIRKKLSTRRVYDISKTENIIMLPRRISCL